MGQFANVRGFTLVELTVTVAIIALLTAVGVPQYEKMQVRARTSGTMSLLLGARSVVMGQRPIENKTAPQMSRLVCLYCSQGEAAGKDLNNFKPTWTGDVANDWGVFGFSQQPYDMWRRPLVAVANEMQQGATDCRHDAIWSAGDDGIWGGPGGNGYSGVGDDLVVAVPYYRQTKAQCPDDFF